MSDLYEIVETAEGEIVLRRADEEGEALVSISFSEEALYYLNKNKFFVAKAMIEAGLEAASDHGDEDDEQDEDSEQSISTLH